KDLVVKLPLLCFLLFFENDTFDFSFRRKWWEEEYSHSVAISVDAGDMKFTMAFVAVMLLLATVQAASPQNLGKPVQQPVQLQPQKVSANVGVRPQQAARRMQQPQPDPLDEHFDHIFNAFVEKTPGKEDSVWDRLKRNFIDEEQTRTKRSVRLLPNSLKGNLLDKVFEASTTAAHAFVKVIDKEYPTRRLLHRVDKALDLVLFRVPPLLNRLDPVLNLAASAPRYLALLEEMANTLRPVGPMIPRVNRLLGSLERIDLPTLAARADNMLIRVTNLPMERIVEGLFNTYAEVRNLGDMASQFQRLAPQLIAAFQQNRGSGSVTTTTTMATTTTEAAAGNGTSSDISTTKLPEGLINIDPRILARFEPKVLQNLNPAVFRRLTPQLIASIDPAFLNALSPGVLRNINPDVIAEVDPKFLRTIKPEVLNALPEEIIRDITPEIVKTFEPELLDSVDPELIKSLDADTIRNLLFPQNNRRSDIIKMMANRRIPPEMRTEQMLPETPRNTGDRMSRRTIWRHKEGTLIKPRLLAKVYEAVIVASKAGLKVVNKAYNVPYLLSRVHTALDITDRLPYILDRTENLFDPLDRLENYLERVRILEKNLQLTYPLLPQLPRMVDMLNQIDFLGLTRKGEKLLDRVANIPIENLVETASNLATDFKSITDLVKQAQSLIPSLIPLFLGNRGGGGSSSSSSSSSSKPASSSPPEKPDDNDESVVFFPPLDEDEEDYDDTDSKETTTSAKQTTSSVKQTSVETTQAPAASSGPKITMMVIDPSVVAKLDPKLLAQIDPKVIQNINPAVFAAITPEILEALDPEKLNQLEPKVLRNLNPEFLRKIDPKVLKAIPPSLLNSLPEELLRDFDPSLLENLDSSVFENLDPDFLKTLDAETIRAFLAPGNRRRRHDRMTSEDFFKTLYKALGPRGGKISYRILP
ncbi:unnamed protein product, partial [Notodromas monacha]